MRDFKKNKKMIDSSPTFKDVPFGASEFDYDDDALEIYNKKEMENLDKEIDEIVKQKKFKK